MAYFKHRRLRVTDPALFSFLPDPFSDLDDDEDDNKNYGKPQRLT